MSIKNVYIVSPMASRYIDVTIRYIMLHQRNIFESHETPKIRLLKSAGSIPIDAGIKNRCALVFIGENGKPRPLEYVKLLNKKGGADIFLVTMSVKLDAANEYCIDSVYFVNKTMFE